MIKIIEKIISNEEFFSISEYLNKSFASTLKTNKIAVIEKNKIVKHLQLNQCLATRFIKLSFDRFGNMIILCKIENKMNAVIYDYLGSYINIIPIQSNSTQFFKIDSVGRLIGFCKSFIEIYF